MTDTILHTVVDSPLGELTLVAVPAGGAGPAPAGPAPGDWALAGLYYPDHVPAPHRETFGTGVAPTDAPLAPLVEAVTAYLDGSAPGVAVPLARPVATPFLRAVWDRVQEIPYGSTATYGEVAAAVGHPGAFRAVGTALSRNALCLAIPCHRVVASGGRITGYAGGTDRKAWLLHHEQERARPGVLGDPSGAAPAGPER